MARFVAAQHKTCFQTVPVCIGDSTRVLRLNVHPNHIDGSWDRGAGAPISGVRDGDEILQERGRARAAVGGRAVRDRHVSADAADHRPGSARLDLRHADDADGVLHRVRRLPDRLWARVRHGRAQAAALFRARPVSARLDRLLAGARDRLADCVPRPSGHRSRGGPQARLIRSSTPAERHGTRGERGRWAGLWTSISQTC